ncbi:MAG: hypothetical protein RMJ59_01180 [Candidatus Nitrosocaldus sp.]|nr:hypothetical protein [Candidatus Nitrosocaldus sp.]MDW8274977.1 hypothetical protein [Candidatus Nitrosocaldus sp.]
MRSKPRYLDYNKPVAVCSTCFTIGKWHCYECGRDFCVEHFHAHKCIVTINDRDGKNSRNRNED